MTVRELLTQLEAMDEDVKDMKICVRVSKQWNQISTIVEGEIVEVPENIDQGGYSITLEAR